MMMRFVCCLFCLLSNFVSVASAHTAPAINAPSVLDAAYPAGHDADVATRLTALTSLSISPILVGGGRSAMMYWRASDSERRHLPWNASPWYWGPLLTLGLCFFVAHLVGTTTPIVGKTVEAARNLESKLAIVYASPLYLAAGTELLESLYRAGLAISPIGNAAAASPVMTAAPVDTLVGGLLGLVVFGVIWLSNKAMHTIVLVSPSALLGALLRIVHLLGLGGLLLAAVVSPFLGAMLAVLIILICAKLAGWSFRLSVFGTVFAWDLLLFRRTHPVKGAVMAFSSRGLALPPRTLGHIKPVDGGLAFVYRPWLIGPSRVEMIAASNRILVYGVFYLHILQLDHKNRIAIAALPPRYRGSEAALASFAACEAVPSPLKGSMRFAMKWLAQL
jgi:hypothetical protein